MEICSIMIIDDDQEDRYLLKRLIKKAKVNCDVYEAENGKIALDFLSGYRDNLKKYDGLIPPLMVFLDINMPIMGGFEFLEEFNMLLKDKKIIDPDELKSIFFTMFSSSEQKEDIERAKSFGFVKGYVTKGNLTKEVLRDTIKKHFPDNDFFIE